MSFSLFRSLFISTIAVVCLFVTVTCAPPIAKQGEQILLDDADTDDTDITDDDPTGIGDNPPVVTPPAGGGTDAKLAPSLSSFTLTNNINTASDRDFLATVKVIDSDSTTVTITYSIIDSNDQTLVRTHLGKGPVGTFQNKLIDFDDFNIKAAPGTAEQFKIVVQAEDETKLVSNKMTRSVVIATPFGETSEGPAPEGDTQLFANRPPEIKSNILSNGSLTGLNHETSALVAVFDHEGDSVGITYKVFDPVNQQVASGQRPLKAMSAPGVLFDFVVFKITDLAAAKNGTYIVEITAFDAANESKPSRKTFEVHLQ